jgi:hypothetical protein
MPVTETAFVARRRMGLLVRISAESSCAEFLRTTVGSAGDQDQKRAIEASGYGLRDGHESDEMLRERGYL